MEGGKDKNGGGGNYLDDWQILRARGYAVKLFEGDGNGENNKFIRYKKYLMEQHSLPEEQWDGEDTIYFWVFSTVPIILLLSCTLASFYYDSKELYLTSVAFAVTLLIFGVDWKQRYQSHCT